MQIIVRVPDLIRQGKIDEAEKLARRAFRKIRIFGKLLELWNILYTILFLALTCAVATCALLTIMENLTMMLYITLILFTCSALLLYVTFPSQERVNKYILSKIFMPFDVLAGTTFACDFIFNILTLYELYRKYGIDKVREYISKVAFSFVPIFEKSIDIHNIRLVLRNLTDTYKELYDLVGDVESDYIEKIVSKKLNVSDLLSRIYEALRIYPEINKICEEVCEKLRSYAMSRLESEKDEDNSR